MFNLNNSNWRADGLDWIGDAIEAIGYHVGFDVKIVPLKIKSFRCKIPSGMESIEWIEHEGHRLPLGIDESDYHFVRFREGAKPNILTDIELSDLSKYIDNLNALREMDPATPGVLDQIENTLFLIKEILGTKYLAGNAFTRWRHHFYNIESTTQYIKTSFEEGIIDVRCRTFKVDLDGKPLLVNTYKYKEAVSWFLISRMILSGYPHPVIKKWEEANAQWDFFREQAANEAKMLSLDELERFRRRWQTVKRQTPEEHRRW